MYKLAGRKKLGRKSSHRRALVNNQLRSLLIHGKVETTTPKAKVLKANADSIIAKLKMADKDASKDILNRYLDDQEDINKVSKYVKESAKVSFVRVGFRAGDNAELSRVDLVGFEGGKEETKENNKGSKKKKETSSKKPVEPDPKGGAPDTDQKPPTDLDEKGKSSFGNNLRGKITGKERVRTRSGI